MTAAVTPNTRLAPASLATVGWPCASRMWRSSAAVVVLPLVPVITIVPLVSARESFVRMAGSTQRETSPGSVVPPPRRNPRLRPVVNFPAQRAAVPRAPSLARITPRRKPAGTARLDIRSSVPPPARWPPHGGPRPGQTALHPFQTSPGLGSRFYRSRHRHPDSAKVSDLPP